ncbi:MAG: glutathione S-transferase family protein [Alphaproteobacteria bacterium]|nr:glutathione S-transferase family protein [Alphaproteobacteria bacterium]
MTKPYKLYATNGCGSMIVEIAFGLAKVPFEIVDVPWSDTGWKSKALKKLNPLGQVPTLLLPDGTVMTESAAILFHLADTVPGFELIPPAGHPSRAEFLRWQLFLVSAVYPTFTYGDVTERWVGEPYKVGAGKLLRESTHGHRQDLWKFVEKQIEGPWFLGETFSALDIYTWAMTLWRPGRDWFRAECPKLHKIGARLDDHPVVKKVAARNKI